MAKRAPMEATARHVEQRITFATTMRLSRQWRPLYMRSAFARPTALRLGKLLIIMAASRKEELCLWL